MLLTIFGPKCHFMNGSYKLSYCLNIGLMKFTAFDKTRCFNYDWVISLYLWSFQKADILTVCGSLFPLTIYLWLEHIIYRAMNPVFDVTFSNKFTPYHPLFLFKLIHVNMVMIYLNVLCYMCIKSLYLSSCPYMCMYQSWIVYYVN